MNQKINGAIKIVSIVLFILIVYTWMYHTTSEIKYAETKVEELVDFIKKDTTITTFGIIWNDREKKPLEYIHYNLNSKEKGSISYCDIMSMTSADFQIIKNSLSLGIVRKTDISDDESKLPLMKYVVLGGQVANTKLFPYMEQLQKHIEEDNSGCKIIVEYYFYKSENKKALKEYSEIVPVSNVVFIDSTMFYYEYPTIIPLIYTCH